MTTFLAGYALGLAVALIVVWAWDRHRAWLEPAARKA
jgi:hypothetical protein